METLTTNHHELDQDGESNMTRRLAGLAAAALVAGGMSLAALGPGVGIAQAEPTTGTWCPGDQVPGGFAHDEVDWAGLSATASTQCRADIRLTSLD